MARQIINVGTQANDGTGDDLRTGGDKINQNFQDLYSQMTALSLSLNLATVNSNGIGFAFDGIIFDGATKDSFQTVTRLIPSNPSQVNIQQLQDSSGVLAFLSDIKKQINRSYVLGIKNTGSTLLDSATAIDAMYAQGFLDSARAVRISLDSADIVSYIDAAYIQARQTHYLDSALALQFLMSETQVDSHFNENIATRDSDIAKLKADVLATSQAFTDDIQENPLGATNLYYTTARHDSDTNTLVTKSFVDALNVNADTLDGVQYSTIASNIDALPDSSQVQTLIDDTLAAIPYDLIPSADSTYDLGSPTNKWKDLHLSGNTIYIGGGTLQFDGSNFSFGGGTLQQSNTLAFDSGQRVFFGSQANITNFRTDNVSELALGANTIIARTNDDAEFGWFVRTNDAFTRLGDYGMVTLPHNTTNARTTYSSNPFYDHSWKTGSLHYNTDLNKLEAHTDGQWDVVMTESLVDSAMTDIVDSSYVQARQVANSYLHYGYDASLSGTQTNVNMFTVNGASPWLGYHLPVPGKATHISWVATASGHTGGSQTFQVELWKNGTATGYINTAEFTGTGSMSMSFGIDVPFNADDGLELKISQDGGLTTQNISALLRIEETL